MATTTTTAAERDGLSRSLSQRQQREEYIWGISEIYRRRRKSQVSPIYRPAGVEGSRGKRASSGMRKEAGTEGEELLNYCSPPLAVSASGTAIEQTREGKEEKADFRPLRRAINLQIRCNIEGGILRSGPACPVCLNISR